MPILSVAALRTQLESGDFGPLYLILGGDEAAKAALAAEFAETVDEGLRAFNVDRFYGGETDAGTVLDAVRTLPMMAPRRIVLVFRAERLLAPKRETGSAARDQEALEAYVKAPAPHATLVFVAADLDRRTRLAGLLQKHGASVECSGLMDPGDAQRWIRGRLDAARVQIEPAASRLVLHRAGADFVRLRADVERLLLYAAGRKTITAEDAREVVGPAVAQDDWAVARAIEQGDAPAALRELALALDAGAVPYVVLGQLGWVARTKVPPSRVKAAVDAVFRADLDLKSSTGDPRVLLERLVVELCGGGSAGPPRERGLR